MLILFAEVWSNMLICKYQSEHIKQAFLLLCISFTCISGTEHIELNWPSYSYAFHLHVSVEPIFNNTSKSDNYCYNDRSENPRFFLYYLSHSIYFRNKDHTFSPVTAEGTKKRKHQVFIGKKSRAFCLACIATTVQTLYYKLPCLISTQFPPVKV